MTRMDRKTATPGLRKEEPLKLKRGQHQRSQSAIAQVSALSLECFFGEEAFRFYCNRLNLDPSKANMVEQTGQEKAGLVGNACHA